MGEEKSWYWAAAKERETREMETTSACGRNEAISSTSSGGRKEAGERCSSERAG